jgi:hypothetical protein
MPVSKVLDEMVGRLELVDSLHLRIASCRAGHDSFTSAYDFGVKPQHVDFEFGIAAEESLVDVVRLDPIDQFAFLQASEVSVAFAVVVACCAPFGIAPEVLRPCGQGMAADIGPLGEHGQEAPDI